MMSPIREYKMLKRRRAQIKKSVNMTGYLESILIDKKSLEGRIFWTKETPREDTLKAWYSYIILLSNVNPINQ